MDNVCGKPNFHGLMHFCNKTIFVAWLKIPQAAENVSWLAVIHP